MRKLRLHLARAALAATSGLTLAGCPESADPGNLATADDLSRSQVIDLLDGLAADPVLPDVAGISIAQTPTLAPEAVDDFAGDFDDVDISDDEFTQQLAANAPPDDRGDIVLARGRLAGRFAANHPGGTSNDTPGTFEGRWFAAGGAVRGVLSGRYRPLDGGDLPPGIVGGGAFQGHYLSPEGEFRGFLSGTYGHARNGRGSFVGTWHGQHMQVIGTLAGAWDDQPRRDGGSFAGHWAAFDICEEADSMDDADDEPGTAQSRRPVAADEAAVATIEDELAALDATALEDYFADVADTFGDAGFDGEIDLLEDTSYCVDGAGLLRGWHRRGLPDGFDPNTTSDADGVWRARWRSASGQRRGYIHGLWTLRPQDDGDDPNTVDEDDRRPRVKGYLVGRVFNDDDRQVGTIRGRFGIGHHGVGVFAGRFVDNDDELAGTVRGRWSKVRGRRGGPLFGAWIHLDEEPGLNDDGSDDDNGDAPR